MRWIVGISIERSRRQTLKFEDVSSSPTDFRFHYILKTLLYIMLTFLVIY